VTSRPTTPVLDMNNPKVRDFVHLHAIKKFADIAKTVQMTNMLRDPPASILEQTKISL